MGECVFDVTGTFFPFHSQFLFLLSQDDLFPFAESANINYLRWVQSMAGAVIPQMLLLSSLMMITTITIMTVLWYIIIILMIVIIIIINLCF